MLCIYLITKWSSWFVQQVYKQYRLLKNIDGDDSPTRWQQNLRLLLLRALNKNQILILSQVENNTTETISSLLRRISKIYGISLSTLKSNVRILKELNLISFGSLSNFQVARLTDFGKFVANIMGSWCNLASIEALGASDKGSNPFDPTKRGDKNERWVLSWTGHYC